MTTVTGYALQRELAAAHQTPSSISGTHPSNVHLSNVRRQILLARQASPLLSPGVGLPLLGCVSTDLPCVRSADKPVPSSFGARGLVCGVWSPSSSTNEKWRQSSCTTLPTQAPPETVSVLETVRLRRPAPAQTQGLITPWQLSNLPSYERLL
jgi:hypothetical protein